MINHPQWRFMKLALPHEIPTNIEVSIARFHLTLQGDLVTSYHLVPIKLGVLPHLILVLLHAFTILFGVFGVLIGSWLVVDWLHIVSSQKWMNRWSPISWNGNERQGLSRVSWTCHQRQLDEPFRGDGDNIPIPHYKDTTLLWSQMGMDQYLLIPFLGGWTSINPSYFGVNKRVPGFWPIPKYMHYHYPY